jgi:hypothetical protein
MQNSFGVYDSARGDTIRRGSEQGSLWVNLILIIISILLSLAVVEVAYRLIEGVPVFKLVDWRGERILVSRIGARRAVPDPVLGWTLKPWHHDEDGYTTIDYGIRSNFGEKAVRTGGILAVGDSFTEGWDVDNDVSWPAFLEKKTGNPVVNAGVFGYATDQIILRAEQLLPIVRPKILIVGFLEYDIFRTGHSDFGAPKPWFSLENGGLFFHPPTPIDADTQRRSLSGLDLKLRDALGYSAAVNALLGRLAPNFWYAGSHILYRKAEIDPVAVTCVLLDRLKKRVEASGIRMLLFMQHNEYLILAGDRSSESARRVVACAEAAGIQVVDQFAALRAIAVVSPEAFRAYYFPDNAAFGHLTDKGNEQAANLLAAALAKEGR